MNQKINATKSEKKEPEAAEMVEVRGNINNPCNKAYSTETPRRLDILCGKDKACVTHEGSRLFRSMIDLYHKRYQTCSTKQEKMDITKEIVEELRRSTGSRFLKYDSKSQSWQEISQMAARDKVSHALRFASQKKERNAKKKLRQSSATKKAPSSCSTPLDAATKPDSSKQTLPKTALRKRCRSDPLPFKNEEDAKLWQQFVKRQQKILKSIQQADLDGTIYTYDDPSVSLEQTPIPACIQAEHMTQDSEDDSVITEGPLLDLEDDPFE